MKQLLSVPIRFHLRNDLHLARKAWHMVMGLLIVLCYTQGLSRNASILILVSILGFDLMMELARLKIPVLNEKLLRFWGPIMRQHEVQRMTTLPHYVTAVIIAIAIFPKPVAILGILYLACGDPVASLFGIVYGHKGPRFASGKSLIGTSAGVLTCILVTALYLKTIGVYQWGQLLGVSFFGGLSGGLVELLPFDIDDNFTIPVVSGFLLWLIFMIAGL